MVQCILRGDTLKSWHSRYLKAICSTVTLFHGCYDRVLTDIYVKDGVGLSVHILLYIYTHTHISCTLWWGLMHTLSEFCITFQAHHKGTTSSKKKKKAKLERAIRSMKRQQRQSSGKNSSTYYSPLNHLIDPQVWYFSLILVNNSTPGYPIHVPILTGKFLNNFVYRGLLRSCCLVSRPPMSVLRLVFLNLFSAYYCLGDYIVWSLNF